MPMATSTPQAHVAKPILKEKQANEPAKPAQKPQKEKKKITFKFDPTAQRPSSSKENLTKPNHRSTPRQPTQSQEKIEEKRRQQAIEAMKIQENRRLRFCQQTLAEDLEQLAMKPATDANNSLMEKKRLEAKQLKEKRILAHLAEQEARKKRAEAGIVRNIESSTRKGPTYQVKTSFSKCLFKPVNEKLSIKESLPKIPEDQELETPQDPPTVRRNIYTKCELRMLNPYGYYFM